MNTHLATTRTQPVVGLDQWKVMLEQAQVLVKTGFLPDAIKTPEQAVAIIMKGAELGVPPMYALSNISVIKGKPTCQAELMLALIYRDHGSAAVNFLETTDKQATIAYRRRGWPTAKQYSFTISDAERAGVTGNSTWRQYPAAMLRARCISAVARMAFPDSIGGMYTPEELGAAVVVQDDGETVVLAPSNGYHETPEVPAQQPAETFGPTPAEVVQQVEAFCAEATTPVMVEAARDFANQHRPRLSQEQRAAVAVAIGLAQTRLTVEADAV